jgi:membrane-associated phospholipid phosphatase
VVNACPGAPTRSVKILSGRSRRGKAGRRKTGPRKFTFWPLPDATYGRFRDYTEWVMGQVRLLSPTMVRPRRTLTARRVSGPLVGGRLRHWLGWLLAGATVWLIAFGIAVVHRRTPLPLEGRADLWLARPAGAEHHLALDLSKIGSPAGFAIALALVVAVLLIAGDVMAAAVAIGASAVQLVLGYLVIKPVVDRYLPPFGGAFPSTHTSNAFVLGVVVALAAAARRPLGRRLGAAPRKILVAVALLVPAAVGWAMLALQAHYLTDVLSGAVLGGASALGVAALADWVTSRRGIRARFS